MKSVLFAILMLSLSAVGQTDSGRSSLENTSDSLDNSTENTLELGDQTSGRVFLVTRRLVEGETVTYDAVLRIHTNRPSGILPDKPLVLRSQFSQVTLPAMPRAYRIGVSFESQRYEITQAQIKSLGATNHWKVIATTGSGTMSFEVDDPVGKINEFVQLCDNDRVGKKVAPKNPAAVVKKGDTTLSVTRSSSGGMELVQHLLWLPDETGDRVFSISRIEEGGSIGYDSSISVYTNRPMGILPDKPLELRSGSWRMTLSPQARHKIEEKEESQSYEITPAQIQVLGNTNQWQISFSTVNGIVTFDAKDPLGKIKEFADLSVEDLVKLPRSKSVATTNYATEVVIRAGIKDIEVVNVMTRVADSNRPLWKWDYSMTVKNRASKGATIYLAVKYVDAAGKEVHVDSAGKAEIGAGESKAITRSTLVDPKISASIVKMMVVVMQ